MKCNQCGTEFEGKFCPECGAKGALDPSTTPPPIQQTQHQNYSQPNSAQNVKSANKKEKPFFLKWWFILLVIIVLGFTSLFRGKGDEKIVWKDMILGEMLPKPSAKKGDIYNNSAEALSISISNLSDKDYADYITACKEKGFTVDAFSDSNTYKAYNQEGYKLELSHYVEDMKIDLKKPMDMTTISWPTSTAGKMLPTPKSNRGSFSYEHDDSFFVYIADTDKASYADYVNACSEAGFNVDYNKGDDFYYADNGEGWNISLHYVGNNVISIEISAPVEEAVATSAPISPTEEPSTPDASLPAIEDTKPIEEQPENTTANGLSSDFKTAMDSYEKFMDEYVAFMKKYLENPTDWGLLADYATFSSDYLDFVNNFEKWENEDLNADELAYYIEVQARVSKKLLEVAY